MDAERPAQREGIPGVVSRDDLEEVYEGMGTIPSRAARRDMVRSMESLDLRTCMRLRQTSALSDADVNEGHSYYFVWSSGCAAAVSIDMPRR